MHSLEQVLQEVRAALSRAAEQDIVVKSLVVGTQVYRTLKYELLAESTQCAREAAPRVLGVRILEDPFMVPNLGVALNEQGDIIATLRVESKEAM